MPIRRAGYVNVSRLKNFTTLRFQDMREKIERISFSTIAILSILISGADILGFWEMIPWMKSRIPSISLFILGTISVYLVLERRSKLDRIDDNTSHLDERMNDLESKYAQISVLFSALGERDHFFEIALIYGLRAYGRLLSEKRVVVDRDHALNFWLDSIRGCIRWHTITYSRPGESWDLEYGDSIALAVQQERIRSGGEIKRLFLVDDDDEFEHIHRVMKEQEKVGVNVRWLLKSEIPKQRRISECIDALGTLDFALVDSSWVWRGHLDRSRRLVRAEAVKDKELAERARVAFNEIFYKGNLP